MKAERCLPERLSHHLSWLTQYDFPRDFKFDLIAGITVALAIVPQEISLASIMHVPAQYGIYTAILTPLLYALLGSSRVLSVANGSEVSLMVGAALQHIPSVDERVAVGIFLSFYVGMINLALGYFKLGVIADFFSRPVMGGFLSAGGVLIMISQLGPLLQLPLPPSTYPLQTLYDIGAHFSRINWTSFGVGSMAIALNAAMKQAKRHWIPYVALADLFDAKKKSTTPSDDHVKDFNIHTPKGDDDDGNHPTWGFSLHDHEYATLDALTTALRAQSVARNQWWRTLGFFLLRTICDLGPLVICTVGIVVGCIVGEHRVDVLGHIPTGFPAPRLPWYGYTDGVITSVRFADVSIQASSIALVVYMTSIAIAKRLAVRDHYTVHPNQELVGLGVASALGAFFQVMPPTGGMSRTAVNMQNARTQMSSIVTVALVVFVLLMGTEVLYYLPKACLAANIIVAGFWLIETDEAKWLYRAKRDEYYVWLASCLLTVGLGILPGLVASIVCSLVAVMVQTKQPEVSTLARVNAPGPTHTVQYVPMANAAGPSSVMLCATSASIMVDILVLRIEGPLYFGNCNNAMELLQRATTSYQQIHHVVLSGVVVDVAYVQDMDATTMQMIERFARALSRDAIGLCLANAQPKLARSLNASGVCHVLFVADVASSIDDTILIMRATNEGDDDPLL
ncbi:hypothetical protein DYB31_004149 [Aphanomyces astaci]|uniref:STAS domain-containing protein n=1 Tax=Aphanomyces astaci TaxID=112090 RepID=A0A397F0M9_APHAT|nr:hypothetical protein DYB31_004149 [Aphanomyces astaci]